MRTGQDEGTDDEGTGHTARARHTWMDGRGTGLASSVAALLLAPASAMAQAVFVPLTPPPSDQSATTFFSTNGLTAESILSAAAPPDPESGNQLRWGPVSAHPRLDYQFISADGIRQGDRSVSTLQHIISPGGNVQL